MTSGCISVVPVRSNLCMYHTYVVQGQGQVTVRLFSIFIVTNYYSTTAQRVAIMKIGHKRL